MLRDAYVFDTIDVAAVQVRLPPVVHGYTAATQDPHWACTEYNPNCPTGEHSACTGRSLYEWKKCNCGLPLSFVPNRWQIAWEWFADKSGLIGAAIILLSGVVFTALPLFI